MYGWKFAYETYFYHLKRKDHRHNMSVMWIPQWLSTYKADFWIDFIMAWPGKVLMVFAGFLLYEDIVLAMFVQTGIFIAFNSVCTLQYLLWVGQFWPMLFMDDIYFRSKGPKIFIGFQIVITVVSVAMWEVYSVGYFNHGGSHNIYYMTYINYFYYSFMIVSMIYYTDLRMKANIEKKGFRITPT